MISIHKFIDALLGRDHVRESSSAGMAEFTVQLRPDEIDGGWIAECVDLPGCVSDGDTIDEALQHLTEAIIGVLSVRLQQHARQITGQLVGGSPADQSTPRRVALAL